MAGPKPEPFDKAFGYAVQRARDERDPKLSREDLAEQAEMSLKVLRQIETCERPARLSEAATIANALAIPLETLLGLGLDGVSAKELRKMLAKLEREHQTMTQRIHDAEADLERTRNGLELGERQLQSYHALRAVTHNEWLKVRMAMEKRGLDVEHKEA